MRQKSIVQDLLRLWGPFICFDDVFSALAGRGLSVVKRRDSLKRTILLAMIREARSRVRKKVLSEGWSGGRSFRWVDQVSQLSKPLINSVAGYTLLRCALYYNQDDDVWLRMRGIPGTNNAAVFVECKETPSPMATIIHLGVKSAFKELISMCGVSHTGAALSLRRAATLALKQC